MSNKIYQVEKTNEEIIKTILINILKMLGERKYIKKENITKIFTNLKSDQVDDLSYSLDLDDHKVGKIFAIKIIQQKITGINRHNDLNNFLNNYKDTPKIVVTKEINKKASQHIINNYPNTEIFLEEEFMINLIDHLLIPKHEPLSDSERDEFFGSFAVKRRMMPKMLTGDPVSRYYNLKSGDVCRIIRPSEKSGFTTTYRLVIKGSIK